jgi:single-strand DNA-binding protein
MTDINIVGMTGNLTRDSELTYTQSGYPVLKFSIANNQSKKSGEEWVEEASFFDFAIFGKRAESLAPMLVKGIKVAVQGKAKQDRWQDQQSGANRSKVQFTADSIVIMTARDSGATSGWQAGGYNQMPQQPPQGYGPPQGQQTPNYAPPSAQPHGVYQPPAQQAPQGPPPPQPASW